MKFTCNSIFFCLYKLFMPVMLVRWGKSLQKIIFMLYTSFAPHYCLENKTITALNSNSGANCLTSCLFLKGDILISFSIYSQCPNIWF